MRAANELLVNIKFEIHLSENNKQQKKQNDIQCKNCHLYLRTTNSPNHNKYLSTEALYKLGLHAIGIQTF